MLLPASSLDLSFNWDLFLGSSFLLLLLSLFIASLWFTAKNAGGNCSSVKRAVVRPANTLASCEWCDEIRYSSLGVIVVCCIIQLRSWFLIIVTRLWFPCIPPSPTDFIRPLLPGHAGLHFTFCISLPSRVFPLKGTSGDPSCLRQLHQVHKLHATFSWFTLAPFGPHLLRHQSHHIPSTSFNPVNSWNLVDELYGS